MSLKIFCIGLPRTGTVSLSVLLRKLGINTEHAPCQLELEYYRGDTAAYTDTPIWVPEYFKKFEQSFPDAKFIYTYRDINKWIASIRRQRFFTSKEMLVEPADEFAYTTVFGFPFRRKKWQDAYNRHCDEVFELFRDKPHKLLSIDITQNCDERIKWSEICRFLEVPMPHEPFPHKNKKYM